MEWVLIFWIMLDRGGGPATATFTSKERCEEAGRLVFAPETKRTPQKTWYPVPNTGNFICVPK